MSDRTAWIEPGTQEVAPGVFRIPLPLPNDGLRAVNVYAIADGPEVVVIDGGWALAESREVLRRGLDRIGYGFADIREFFVTHLHRDHFTQAIALRRTFGTPVSVGEGEAASLRAVRTASGTGRGLAGLLAAGATDLAREGAQFHVDPSELLDFEEPNHWLADGVDIALKTRTLRVIATPGHTQGHVVFHEPNAHELFAGDHVLPHITPSIGLEPIPSPSPLRSYLDSLRLMLALPDATLFPAHGPAAPSTHARVEELLAHHEVRLTATAEAVSAGASTGFEVAQALTWTRRLTPFSELDQFNQVLAVHETVSHLQVLVERGWLQRTTVDGVTHFARA
jgi:glyoxylase-like metal-dependent hydrolase (beta-lactamase superfamily II)